jgi:hypothetical protein
MPYPQIDPAEIRVYPLAQRYSKTRIRDVAIDPDTIPPDLPASTAKIVQRIADRIRSAHKRGSSVMLAFGAHLIKNGAAPLVIRLLEQGWLTHVATNGAGGIHDWEFAFQGASEEDVRTNAGRGCFGTWDETGRWINLAVQVGALKGMGYGESLGRLIHEQGLYLPTVDELKERLHKAVADNTEDLPAVAELYHTLRRFNLPAGFQPLAHPHQATSVFANAVRCGVPITVHPGIGYDIIYNHPLANGAALGRGAYVDFRIFAQSVRGLADGVFLSIGSAIMAPQVFEKSFSLANNLAGDSGRKISGHLIAVVDLQESVWDWSQGEPPKSSPDYYLRFLKSFYRMGGETHYLALDNRMVLHHLLRALSRP